MMQRLVIADKHIVGDVAASWGIWSEGTSTINNSYKGLNYLVDAGKLVKGNGFYKLPDCRSEYKEHSQLLTKAIAEILKVERHAQIFREHSIKEKALRPDAIIFLTHDSKGICFFLEVCNNEKPEYLQAKMNAIKNWPEAKEYLSNLFKTKINEFDIVLAGDLISDDAIAFNIYIEEVKNEIYR